MNIKELEQKIENANVAYRKGESIITDIQYDTLLDELEVLDPKNLLLTTIGNEVIDNDRKESLPIPMNSMNKVKTIDELVKWFKLKNIPTNVLLVAMPKFDGVSLVVEEILKKAFTRGNGVVGQRSDEHLDRMNTNNIDEDIITFGEAIMRKRVFLDKYSKELSNPRNTVSGKLNDKNPSEILEDVEYIRYGLVGKNFTTKVEQLNYLNSLQTTKVDYKTFTIDQLSEDVLMNLFEKWNNIFEIDGVILEVDDRNLWDKLGKETSSGNPVGSRAYKSEKFTKGVACEIINITWEISKGGMLKPVGNITPTKIGGVIVRNVTLYNARFVKENNIGVGTKVEIIRSGFVIPKVIRVIESTGFTLPTIDGVSIEWNESGVELVTTSITSEQRLKQLISFFEIMGVDEIGPNTINQFFENGFDTPKKVLEMTKEDMLKLERFGDRKAEKIINSINDKRNITLCKLQHASGFFNNLGSKKLLLLEDLYEERHPSISSLIEEIVSREGFSEISAQNYIDGIEPFILFESELSGLLTINLTEVKEEVAGGNLEGMAFLFTGVRLKEKELLIKEMGGVIKSSISKNVTHLVCKDKSSTSGKMVKAKKLGLTIMDVDDLEKLLSV